jgi:hypothetical protein
MKRTGGRVVEQRSSRAAALYIAALARELARLARGHRMDGVAYILDMAHMEAERIATGPRDRSGRST